MSENLKAGREAYVRQDWDEAFERLVLADASEALEPEDLEILGEVAHAAGHHAAYQNAHERAYGAHVERGNHRRAAHAALIVTGSHFERGEWAVAMGWLATAGRLLEGEPECVELGWYTAIQAWAALLLYNKPHDAIELAERAVAIAETCTDRDVEIAARAFKGWALARSGQVTEGMALLDEAMVAVVGGQLGPGTSQLVYCNTILTCHFLGDWRRAGEWTDASTRAFEERRVVPLRGDCRIHHAELLGMRGEWDQAEAEARCGCEDFEQGAGDRNHVGIGL